MKLLYTTNKIKLLYLTFTAKRNFYMGKERKIYYGRFLTKRYNPLYIKRETLQHLSHDACRHENNF